MRIRLIDGVLHRPLKDLFYTRQEQMKNLFNPSVKVFLHIYFCRQYAVKDCIIIANTPLQHGHNNTS